MFTLELIVHDEIRDLSPIDRDPQYDDKMDNESSAVCGLCDILAEVPGIQFAVGGFGQERWPTDVWMDLSTVLIKLPAILNGMYSDGYKFQIDFGYRKLQFVEKDGIANIKCISFDGFQPKPEITAMKREDLERQFNELYRSFCSVVKENLPKFSQNKMYLKWKNSIQLSPAKS